jgi:hypothetical protein
LVGHEGIVGCPLKRYEPRTRLLGNLLAITELPLPLLPLKIRI